MASPSCQNIAPLTATDIVYQAVPGSAGTAGATLAAVGGSSVIVDGPSEGPVNFVTTNGLYNPQVFELTLAEGMKFVIEQGVGVRSMTDLNGNSLTINSNGIIHSSGKSVTFTRDAQGRITQITDPAGNAMTYTYDAAGNQVTMKDARNNVTTFEYDVLNRRVKTIYADALFDQVSFDALGRNISKTDQAGKTTQFGYDSLGRLTSVTDALNQVTNYGYDELGNELTQTDALNRVTKFEYDKLAVE